MSGTNVAPTWTEKLPPASTRGLGTRSRMYLTEHLGCRLSVIVSESPEGRYVSVAASRAGTFIAVPGWAVGLVAEKWQLAVKPWMTVSGQIHWDEAP